MHYSPTSGPEPGEGCIFNTFFSNRRDGTPDKELPFWVATRGDYI